PDQTIDQAGEGTTLGPVTDAGVKAIDPGYRPVEYPVNRADHNADDPTPRALDGLSHSAIERVVILVKPLTHVDDFVPCDSSVFPESGPVLALFLGCVDTRAEKKRWFSGEDRLSRNRSQRRDPSERRPRFR